MFLRSDPSLHSSDLLAGRHEPDKYVLTQSADQADDDEDPVLALVGLIDADPEHVDSGAERLSDGDAHAEDAAQKSIARRLDVLGGDLGQDYIDRDPAAELADDIPDDAVEDEQGHVWDAPFRAQPQDKDHGQRRCNNRDDRLDA